MKKRTERGFTLVELTVVILVLGVIIAFVLPAFTNKTDSSQAKAIGTVSGYLAEYEREHTTDHVDNAVVIHCADDTLYIFGYNFGDKVLWMFSGATWLVQAQGNMKNRGFAVVADNIVKSANNESSEYPDASGIFTGKTNLRNEFSSRTQKKMDGNTVFLNAEINKNYSQTYGGIEYKFIRADGETGDATAAATYTTVFKDANDDVLHTFSTEHESTFVCPNDPTQAGKQFLYWELVKVNDETKSIPGTALVPGETYDVPNSNVEYKAVYDDDGVPEKKGGAYQLYGAKHLKWFAEYVNDSHGGANATLCRSFTAGTLSTAIGSETHPFHGTFDGKGYTIMDLTMTVSGTNTHTALFGYTDGATIKDLTLINPTITGNTYVSALVAEAVARVNNSTGAYTSTVTTITNCKIVGANITCADVKAADGATPQQIETLAQTAIFKDRYEVQNVDVGGTLTPTAVLTQTEQGTYCGGLVGFGENVDIKKCSVSGVVKGGNNGVAVGGIMGCASGSHVVIGMSGSEDIGASTDATVSGVRYVGGLIGKTTDSAQIAAIIPAVTVEKGVEIYNSYNAGKVQKSAEVMKLPEQGYLATDKTEYCIAFGGLVGGSQNSFLTVTGSDTTKNASVHPEYESSHTGGILGYAEKGEIAINSCTNNAEISSRYSAGGIVGASRDIRLIITDSTNNGTVAARNTAAGGILGYAKTSQTNTRAAKVVQIIDCTNKASVTTVKRAGGILGEAERTVTITGTKNTAKVTESFKNLWELEEDTGCGGIVGYSVGKLMLTDCENSGDVISSCEGVGGIVGRATSVTLTKTSDVPTVEDINGTTPSGDPAEVTLTSNLSEITKCVNTGNVKNIAKTEDLLADPDATPTPTPVEPTPTPDPLATPDPTPAAPYKYAGGIVGYADKVVLIDYCINAAYIQGNTNVGGIAGALVKPEATPTPTPTATVNPNIVNRDPEPGEPTPTPTPTQSAIRHSISVGIVESQAETDGVAGAIIGTNEWDLSFSRNVYLRDMVHFITAGVSHTEIVPNIAVTDEPRH